MSEYKHEIVNIVVPSTHGGDVLLPLELDARLVRVNADLCELFGGNTDNAPSSGNWFNDEGENVPETVIVSWAIDFETGNRDKVRVLIDAYKVSWKQECVLVFWTPCHAELR